MSGEVWFDVVSEFDAQELRNALEQVRRETIQRYDFRGATVDLQQGEDALARVTAPELRPRSRNALALVRAAESRASALKNLILSRAARRGLSLKLFDWGTVEPSGGNK